MGIIEKKALKKVRGKRSACKKREQKGKRSAVTWNMKTEPFEFSFSVSSDLRRSWSFMFEGCL